MHIATVETCFNPWQCLSQIRTLGTFHGTRLSRITHHMVRWKNAGKGFFCRRVFFLPLDVDMMKNDEWMLWIEKWWTNSFLQKGNVSKTHLLICVAFRSPWSRHLRHSPPPRSWLKSQVLWLQEIRKLTKKSWLKEWLKLTSCSLCWWMLSPQIARKSTTRKSLQKFMIHRCKNVIFPSVVTGRHSVRVWGLRISFKHSFNEPNRKASGVGFKLPAQIEVEICKNRNLLHPHIHEIWAVFLGCLRIKSWSLKFPSFFV